MQEGVEEVYGEETQVGQPLQQPLHAGVADLGDLAGVERLAEANVNIIFMETHIGSDGYTRTHTHKHTHNQAWVTTGLLSKEKVLKVAERKQPSKREKSIQNSHISKTEGNKSGHQRIMSSRFQQQHK